MPLRNAALLIRGFILNLHSNGVRSLSTLEARGRIEQSVAAEKARRSSTPPLDSETVLPADNVGSSLAAGIPVSSADAVCLTGPNIPDASVAPTL